MNSASERIEGVFGCLQHQILPPAGVNWKQRRLFLFSSVVMTRLGYILHDIWFGAMVFSPFFLLLLLLAAAAMATERWTRLECSLYGLNFYRDWDG